MKQILQIVRMAKTIDHCDAVIELFFSVADYLHFIRKAVMPGKWHYIPSLVSTEEIPKIWMALFAQKSDEELIKIGNFCHRYLNMTEGVRS